MSTAAAAKNGRKPTVEDVLAKDKQTGEPLLAIDEIKQGTMHVPILGVSPLIMHRFAEKAKRQMLDAMQGRKTPKEAKDPEKEYESAFYRMEDGTPGFPADAFKQATVGAARFYGKELSMTALKQYVFVHGEPGDDGRPMVRIDAAAPQMREDVVRVGRGTDLRYRPSFFPWRATLTVMFFPAVLTQASVLSLIDAGGLAVGVGEWRPERDGTFGTYRIDPDRKVEVIL